MVPTRYTAEQCLGCSLNLMLRHKVLLYSKWTATLFFFLYVVIHEKNTD